MRPTCPHCQRPQKTCICPLARPQPSRVDVIILQHPQEVTHAKGSARLLHLCLPNSRLLVGEVFEHEQLAAMQGTDKQDFLLYPAANGETVTVTTSITCPEKIRLWLLDATWRKSRAMLQQNPFLQQMPKLALHTLPANRYQIRKAHAPHQLSSLQACVQALSEIEAEPAKYDGVLQAFDALLAQWLGFAEGENLSPDQLKT